MLIIEFINTNTLTFFVVTIITKIFILKLIKIPKLEKIADNFSFSLDFLTLYIQINFLVNKR